MLIIALVLALVGLVALVFAVVTSNELVAWVCIAASVLGVVLLIIDAVQERRRRDAGGDVEGSGSDSGDEAASVDYPEEVADDESASAAGTEATEESAVSTEGRSDDHA
ncbi:MAG: hypothetical protein WBR28_09405 [Mycobacterium sp.]